MKKVSGTLTKKAEKYWHEVAAGLDFGDGKLATQTQIINYMVETLSDIEDACGDPIDFLVTVHGKDYSKEAKNKYKP